MGIYVNLISHITSPNSRNATNKQYYYSKDEFYRRKEE